VLCAGSTLPLAKQSLDEAPYKLSGAVAKLTGITFSRLSLSYWIDNLGFITEGKLTVIFIKTFSWGFPTGRSFLLHQLSRIIGLVSDFLQENYSLNGKDHMLLWKYTTQVR
jgi:hypothetical protein